MDNNTEFFECFLRKPGLQIRAQDSGFRILDNYSGFGRADSSQHSTVLNLCGGVGVVINNNTVQIEIVYYHTIMSINSIVHGNLLG